MSLTSLGFPHPKSCLSISSAKSVKNCSIFPLFLLLTPLPSRIFGVKEEYG
jgi:hypothetical protein